MVELEVLEVRNERIEMYGLPDVLHSRDEGATLYCDDGSRQEAQGAFVLGFPVLTASALAAGFGVGEVVPLQTGEGERDKVLDRRMFLDGFDKGALG